MKKIFSSISGLALVAVALTGIPAATFAQTATTTASSSVQAQLNLIATLTAQVQALQQQLLAVQQQRQVAMVQLVNTLQVGSQGDQVKILQALLAADPSIFPEGSITGFFGPATSRAVKRFQKMHGLAQVGKVGPKTLEKLNEWLGENPIELESTSTVSMSSTSIAMGHGKEKENDNNQGDENEGDNEGEGHGHPCAIVPPGHLIAPGWLRKHGDERPIVPPCQVLPPGILQKLGLGTSTAPIVSGVVAAAGTSTATISWMTNVSANSQVMYGTSTAYGLMNTLDSGLVTSHSQMLTNLTPGTLYHFEVISKDIINRTATSSDMTFMTAGVTTTTTPLTISSPMVTPGTSTASVSWGTSAAANSQIMYGTSTAYGLMTTLDASLVATHTQMLTGLTPATMYHFQVKSIDALSNMATSSDMTFTTNALPVVTLPMISGISASSASTTASISWTTNVGANGMVFYSTTTPVNLMSTSTPSVSTTTLGTSHTLGLTGLTASTTYFYVIQSTDGSSNIVTSTQQSFMTAGM